MTSNDDRAGPSSVPGQPPGGVIDFLITLDGYRLRYGIWIVPADANRGTVVLLHGRTEFIEKHFETITDLLARGFSVFTIDWRGQGLSGPASGKPIKGHVGDYGEYVSDLGLFLRSKVEPLSQGPLYLLAHSMGAHLALRYCHDHPGFFERAALCAPLIQPETGPIPGVVTQLSARLASSLGLRTKCVPGRDKYRTAKKVFAGNPLTSDPGRYRIAADWIERNPDLAVGPPTIGWLDAMYRSIAEIHRPGYAGAIETQILMAVGECDDVVSVTAARQYCDSLPHGRFVPLPHARHEILHETDEIRATLWAALDSFLEPNSRALE